MSDPRFSEPCPDQLYVRLVVLRGEILEFEHTTETEVWDRWVEALLEPYPIEGAEVRLLDAQISWGRDLAPQLRRVLERVRAER